MKYVGSKNRIAKDILPIILYGRTNEVYVEPFCGGCNLIDKVDGKRIANDTQFYLIEFLKALRDGWLPPKIISKEEYENIKSNYNVFEPRLVGYVAYQLSYGSIWFGSYRRDNIGKRNYSLEAYNNIKKQAPKLRGIKFFCGDYRDVIIPNNSIIYCDPPYKNTIKYRNDFNHEEFWDWVRIKSKSNKVFISEYSAPDDFECIWSKKLRCEISKNDRVERLFTIA